LFGGGANTLFSSQTANCPILAGKYLLASSDLPELVPGVLK
jgi:hypothetical protein